tara:strand:- start:455 stop:580 length:126 start_codon:yes stop_codon:yes gene_type:complete
LLEELVVEVDTQVVVVELVVIELHSQVEQKFLYLQELQILQ